MHIKRTINNLTLYKTDLYEGKIIIIPNSKDIALELNPTNFIQTDARCWKKEDGKFKISYGCYNYILVRKFLGCKNIENELYYDIDDLKDKGLDLENLFPIMPNYQILKYYLMQGHIPKKYYQKYIKYTSNINANFYRNGI